MRGVVGVIRMLGVFRMFGMLRVLRLCRLGHIRILGWFDAVASGDAFYDLGSRLGNFKSKRSFRRERLKE